MIKRIFVIIGIIGVGALGLFLFLLNGGKPDIYASRIVAQHTPEVVAVPITEEEEETENIVDTKVPFVTTKGTFVALSETTDDTVLVTRVVDGDTIEIESGEKVRYIGVNTPESVDPRRKVQCFGKEASAYNKKLVLGKRVRLEPDVEDRDKYGRLLRYVWIGDTMINEQLVADGYAQVMTIPPNVKYVERFRTAQTQARETKRGLWEKCKNRS